MKASTSEKLPVVFLDIELEWDYIGRI